VRFMALAIFLTGDLLRECAFSSRTSAFDQERRLARLPCLLVMTYLFDTTGVQVTVEHGRVESNLRRQVISATSKSSTASASFLPFISGSEHGLQLERFSRQCDGCGEPISIPAGSFEGKAPRKSQRRHASTMLQRCKATLA
jgi:hypothetical protein